MDVHHKKAIQATSSQALTKLQQLFTTLTMQPQDGWVVGTLCMCEPSHVQACCPFHAAWLSSQ